MVETIDERAWVGGTDIVPIVQAEHGVQIRLQLGHGHGGQVAGRGFQIWSSSKLDVRVHCNDIDASALGRHVGVVAGEECFDFRAYPLCTDGRLQAIAMSLVGRLLSVQGQTGDNILQKRQWPVRGPGEEVTAVGRREALKALEDFPGSM